MQIYSTCFGPYAKRAEDRSGAMQGGCMHRIGVWCIDCGKMTLPQCPATGSSQCEASLWLNTTTTNHPLSHYGLAAYEFDFVQNFGGTKCISHVPYIGSVDTHNINRHNPHYQTAIVQRSDSCVTCLHVVNFYRTRLHPPPDVEEEGYRIREEQLWSVREGLEREPKRAFGPPLARSGDKHQHRRFLHWAE